MDIAKIRKEKILASNSSDRPYMYVFRQLSSHLLKISLFIITASFALMFYIVNYTDEEPDCLKKFNCGQKESEVLGSIHPYYIHTQQAHPNHQKTTADTISLSEFNDRRSFYRDYLSQNTPVVVEQGCKEWKAFENW